MAAPSPDKLERGDLRAAFSERTDSSSIPSITVEPLPSEHSSRSDEETAVAMFWKEEHRQLFTEDFPLEFAQWQDKTRIFVILNVLLGCCHVANSANLEPRYADINGSDAGSGADRTFLITGLLNAACCFLVAALHSVRRLRPTVLKYEMVFSVVPQTILMCLLLTVLTFADMRRVNHRYCPTLLISLDYANAFPRRHCENTDPAATTRCVIESFSPKGLACTSGVVDGLSLVSAATYAFMPVFKQMSPRAALMVVVVYVVAIPASGIAVGADVPLIVLHTFFVAMLGLSVVWLRFKGLKLSKRRFMVNKILEQRAERNRSLLGALIPLSVQIKVKETASSGEPVKAWNLPHITMLCIKFNPSVSELSLDPATAQNAFELLDGLISALDDAVDLYGMYKYQHVNDTYLVSCPRGALPDIDEEHEPYPEEYTIQMALLAFRIRKIVSTFYTHAGKRISVQAGLNCGPAAGAVVGESRRFYCIYGDILNTASRFCSSAAPGEVVCSHMFYQRVPRHAWGLIHFGARPSVTLKGKGRMEVFLLTPGADTHLHPGVHQRTGLRETSTSFTTGLENVRFFFCARSGGDAPSKLRTMKLADPKIWSAHERGPDRTLVQAEAGAAWEEHGCGQIHQCWCTLLDPELEAKHQGDAFVVAEDLQGFMFGLLVLSITVGTAFIDIYVAAGRPPGFLLVLTVVVIVASLFFAMLAWKQVLHRRNFNRIFVALQICCYVTPVLEHFWGGLDAFPFSYFLEFFMPMVVFTSIYAVTSVNAQVFTSIFMSVIFVPLCVANGGFVVYLTSRFVYHAFAVVLGLAYRRAEEMERRAKWLEQHLAFQEFLRTQEILYDLLPSNVVRKMRDNPDAKSSCETRLVVVLVLDLCNFTKISQEGTPLQLIGYINSIFSAFDREVKKQGLFKMDTIGDAYVAAGLLNSLDPAEATERCAAMIRLSQRMLKVLEDHREVSGKDLRCRIGISTGEVYAGVLGRLQPRYHLFGEPMRTAEQLEQRCAVDGVHVSAPVMEALSSRPGLQKESAPGLSSRRRTATSSTAVRSPINRTEVDIPVGDQGTIFLRSRSAEDNRVAPGLAQIKDGNPTSTTVGEGSGLSPGAPLVPLRPILRTRSLPSTFITWTPSSERAHPSRSYSAEETLPAPVPAARLALVDHYKASTRGSSYQLTVTAETNGPMGHTEKELYARMMTAFAVQDSDTTSPAAFSSALTAVQRNWGVPSSPQRGGPSRWKRLLRRSVSMVEISPTTLSHFQAESSLVFHTSKVTPRRHGTENRGRDGPGGGGGVE